MHVSVHDCNKKVCNFVNASKQKCVQYNFISMYLVPCTGDGCMYILPWMRWTLFIINFHFSCNSTTAQKDVSWRLWHTLNYVWHPLISIESFGRFCQSNWAIAKLKWSSKDNLGVINASESIFPAIYLCGITAAMWNDIHIVFQFETMTLFTNVWWKSKQYWFMQLTCIVIIKNIINYANAQLKLMDLRLKFDSVLIGESGRWCTTSEWSQGLEARQVADHPICRCILNRYEWIRPAQQVQMPDSQLFRLLELRSVVLYREGHPRSARCRALPWPARWPKRVNTSRTLWNAWVYISHPTNQTTTPTIYNYNKLFPPSGARFTYDYKYILTCIHYFKIRRMHYLVSILCAWMFDDCSKF